MTEQQQTTIAQAGACPHPEAVGVRWGDPISEERQAELRALADRQREWAAQPEATRGDSHFTGVALTGADVFWLAAHALAGPEGDLAALQQELRRFPVYHKKPGMDVYYQEGMDLAALYLEGADLRAAQLEAAVLGRAHLAGVNLVDAHLEGANFIEAHLEGAHLAGAYLEGADLFGAYLVRAVLSKAHLACAHLHDTHLEGANLVAAHLEGADLRAAHLEGAYLRGAHLEGRSYTPGDEDLIRIRQSVTIFPEHLPPADLRRAFLSAATALDGIRLGDATGGAVSVADVRWGGANLAVVDWTPFIDRTAVLGDERAVHRFKPKPHTEREPFSERALVSETEDERQPSRRKRAPERARSRAEWATETLQPLHAAVRANRQLATALREQGMNEEADRFAYRAQILQRRVVRRQGKLGRALGSWLLDALAGYGYNWGRTLAAYLLLIGGFAVAYWLLGPTAGHTFAPDGALVFSVTSFHGRGFFPGGLDLENWLARLAALEAVLGLFIEITFIATFTQRFFAR
jgi:uncharacterized protein YjbI with pentapeptide repeats